MRTLIVESDPRLALRQVKAPDLANYYWRSDGKNIQWVLEFERPIEKTVTVVFDCHLHDLHEDNLTMPELHLIGGQVGARLFALPRRR